MALMNQYGRPEEAGAYSVMTLESGPFLTMMTLGVAGLSAFPWQALVGGILPLAAGILIGNLDRDMREFLGRAAPTLIPFFAFALGGSLDLTRIWQAGLLGLAMGVGVVLISGVVLLIADRLSGGNGTAGVAAASTAGNAVRMLVKEVLKDLGYAAIEAADGASGLRVLRSDIKLDLLVTDVGLPGGMNGRQVADAGRSIRAGLKVLFTTGYAENALLNHGHLDPGMHVMTKPFAMDALGKRIKDLINAR